MKTSNRLLLALAVVLLAGLLGTNFALRAEYESIRKNPRPVEGFSFVNVPRFSHVRINSASPGLEFVVRQGGRAGVQANRNLAGKIRFSVRHDTLLVAMPASKLRGGVAACIDAPPASIVYENGTGSIRDFTCQSLRVHCKGGSRVSLAGSQIGALAVETENRAVFSVEMTVMYSDKGIGNLYAAQRDSSQILLGGTRLHGWPPKQMNGQMRE